MSFKATTNKTTFDITESSNEWRLGDESFAISHSEKSNKIIQIIDSAGKMHEAIIQSIDADKKQVKLHLNQKEIIVDILEPIDQKMLSLGIDTQKLQKIKSIKAPMPGLILKTLVTEGQSVKSGEPLFILEAMKMENVFKAPNDVQIKNIMIKEGETVDKNQELIVFG